ncbi:MAG: lactate utilization protein [Pseudoflavonifractor sp.]
MSDITKLRKNLEDRGFHTSFFETAEEAGTYLDGKLDGKTIGMGGSMTARQMGLPDLLPAHNTMLCHWSGSTTAEAAAAEVYISSANGVAETGEIVNIDGIGNRVASTIFGHEALYLVIGVNKIRPTFEEALWRARNIAAPKNAQRLGRKTPCAVKGDHCYDCNSPERICRALAVLWTKPGAIPYAEVIIVNQDLGL